MKLAYLFDPESLVFIGSRKIHPVKGYSDYVRPQLSSWTPVPEYDKNSQLCMYKPDQDAWEVVHKNVKVKAYSKQTREEKEFGDVSLIPDGYVLSAPESPYDSWIEGRWQYDKERERIPKATAERKWRNAELRKVLDRLDQYQKDQGIPEKYRTYCLHEEDYEVLLNERKILCDYPQTKDFPFGERPVLATTVNLGVY